MLDFLGKRIQNAMAKMTAKNILTDDDIKNVTREIKMALLEADVNLRVVKSFIANIKEKVVGQELIGTLNPGQQVVKIVKEELVQTLGGKTKEISFKENPSVIMMTGLQGSGKTTTTAKLVKHLMKKHKKEKPLMVAADVYRPAAIEQLVTLGKQLRLDVYSEGVDKNPRDIVENAIKSARENQNDLVIIDTAGRLSVDEDLMQELVDIKSIAKPTEIFFVADALSGQDIINVAKTFNEKLNLTGSIITKLDSDARGGAALSIRQVLNLPIVYIGTGEAISNLDIFHPDRMADRILGMGDVLSLIEKAGEVIDEKKSKRMLNRMASGNFDLTDLMDQLKQMKKMGKMSKVMKMIPGIGNKINKEQMNSAETRMKLYEIIISSMTLKEQKNPKLLKNASRKDRIIKGSGRTVSEYNSLINEFEKMSKKMKSFSKSLKDGSFNPGMLGF